MAREGHRPGDSGENEAKAKVAASNAELNVKQAEAYQIGETRKREADAAVAEAQFRAQAKAALAEAEKVEAEQRAKLEAQAKAEKARVIVDAEAAAERRRLEARAEADAVFARLEAEARGQYEQLAKKAEGLKAIVDACGGAQQAFQLLMLEHMDKLSETAAQAISNIKFDKVVVWDAGANGHNGNGDGNGNGVGATAGFLRNMAHDPAADVADHAGDRRREDARLLRQDGRRGRRPLPHQRHPLRRARRRRGRGDLLRVVVRHDGIKAGVGGEPVLEVVRPSAEMGRGRRPWEGAGLARTVGGSNRADQYWSAEMTSPPLGVCRAW